MQFGQQPGVFPITCLNELLTTPICYSLSQGRSQCSYKLWVFWKYFKSILNGIFPIMLSWFVYMTLTVSSICSLQFHIVSKDLLDNQYEALDQYIVFLYMELQVVKVLAYDAKWKTIHFEEEEAQSAFKCEGCLTFFKKASPFISVIKMKRLDFLTIKYNRDSQKYMW